MCGLYGFLSYGKKPIKNLSVLTNSLAEQAAVRGKDATGIAYADKGKIVIHKEAKAAYSVDFKHPDDAVCVTGHTRHTTQGNEKKNYNNHPFGGSCRNLRFALCHNGILTNDNTLKKTYHLPKTKIETDSYAAVQLLEQQKQLNLESIKFMAETVSGSFAFTLLDSSNTLWLIRGDSPLSLIHLPKCKMYIYASTNEILYKALVDTKLFDEIKNGDFEEIPIKMGEIIKIAPDGTFTSNEFEYMEYYGDLHWWDYGYYGAKRKSSRSDSAYTEELKSVAAYQGYSEDEIDYLIESGFTLDEIEEYIYCRE